MDRLTETMNFSRSVSGPGQAGRANEFLGRYWRYGGDAANCHLFGSCSRLGRFGDEAVSHLAQALDLGLHDIAGFEESVGALADAATGPATENVAGFERKNARCVFDLLFRRENELRGVAILLDVAIDGKADEQVRVVGHEGARHQKRADRAKLSWLLPPSQSE